MTRLVIFDLDGTLLNTLQDLADSANYMLEQHHFPTYSADAYKYFVGNGMPKLIERIMPGVHAPKELFNECLKMFLDYYTIHMSDKTEHYPGITDLLKSLKERGIKIAVATNKAHEVLPELFASFFPEVAFDICLGQRPGIPVKPDPQMVYDILETTGCAAAETLYLGDTGVDIQTALAASVTPVGVLWGYRPRSEMEAAGATLFIEHPLDLLNLL
ncbi:MAG: HAD family hydrolase [Bacteroidales bacterium]|nr:HAD family hydrolase [Bacteroidales bacterium]